MPFDEGKASDPKLRPLHLKTSIASVRFWSGGFASETRRCRAFLPGCLYEFGQPSSSASVSAISGCNDGLSSSRKPYIQRRRPPVGGAGAGLGRTMGGGAIG